jgi:hypothetical protein
VTADIRLNGRAPLLQAANLWEKTSAKGNPYLVGRLGGVRILILKNRLSGTDGSSQTDPISRKPIPQRRRTSPDAPMGLAAIHIRANAAGALLMVGGDAER